MFSGFRQIFKTPGSSISRTDIFTNLVRKNFFQVKRFLNETNDGDWELQSFTKYLTLTLVFMWNSKLRGKFIFCIWRVFFLVLTKCSFCQEDWALGYDSVNFWDFPDISPFPKILNLFVCVGTQTRPSAKILWKWL